MNALNGCEVNPLGTMEDATEYIWEFYSKSLRFGKYLFDITQDLIKHRPISEVAMLSILDHLEATSSRA